MLVRLAALAPLLLVAGCIHVQTGIQDHSTTAGRVGQVAPEHIAVLAVPGTAVLGGLEGRLEEALVRVLRSQWSEVEVLAPEAFGVALRRRGLLARFARWKATYDETKVHDRTSLRYMAQASGVGHWLLVRAVHLDRQLLPWADAEKTRRCCFGVVRDHWRARLTISAELIDASAGKTVWSGEGEATHTGAAGKTTFSGAGGVAIHHRSPQVAEVAADLIETATAGIAREIAVQNSSARQ